MLLPREQAPWNCGYYLGAVALDVLSAEGNRGADLFELQRAMAKEIKKTVSPTQVIAAAAWLFLLDAIRLDENGRLVKCS